MLKRWHCKILVSEIVRGQRQSTYSLEGPNPSTLDDLERLDASTSDGEVLIGGGDCVDHFE
jgi:hypothetical protein